MRKKTYSFVIDFSVFCARNWRTSSGTGFAVLRRRYGTETRRRTRLSISTTLKRLLRYIRVVYEFILKKICLILNNLLCNVVYCEYFFLLKKFLFWRCISTIELPHLMIKLSVNVKNLKFINISHTFIIRLLWLIHFLL